MAVIPCIFIRTCKDCRFTVQSREPSPAWTEKKWSQFREKKCPKCQGTLDHGSNRHLDNCTCKDCGFSGNYEYYVSELKRRVEEMSEEEQAKFRVKIQ